MSEKISDLEQAVDLALKLSPLDKVHLVERVMTTLERELSTSSQKPKRKRSLYGLWSDVSISAEEIDEARREMWGNFPREDI
jgi:hypothetical protein